MPTNTIKVRESIDYILNVFSGTDGGGSFIRLMATLRALSNQADGGDCSAEHLLDIVYRFHRLIEVIQSKESDNA